MPRKINGGCRPRKRHAKVYLSEQPDVFLSSKMCAATVGHPVEGQVGIAVGRNFGRDADPWGIIRSGERVGWVQTWAADRDEHAYVEIWR